MLILNSTPNYSENSLHFFFDPHLPSMGFRDGEKKTGKLRETLGYHSM